MNRLELNNYITNTRPLALGLFSFYSRLYTRSYRAWQKKKREKKKTRRFFFVYLLVALARLRMKPLLQDKPTVIVSHSYSTGTLTHKHLCIYKITNKNCHDSNRFPTFLNHPRVFLQHSWYIPCSLLYKSTHSGWNARPGRAETTRVSIQTFKEMSLKYPGLLLCFLHLDMATHNIH